MAQRVDDAKHQDEVRIRQHLPSPALKLLESTPATCPALHRAEQREDRTKFKSARQGVAVPLDMNPLPFALCSISAIYSLTFLNTLVCLPATPFFSDVDLCYSFPLEPSSPHLPRALARLSLCSKPRTKCGFSSDVTSRQDDSLTRAFNGRTLWQSDAGG